MKLVLLAPVAAVLGCGATPPLKIRFYGEAECPDCRAFSDGALTEFLSAFGQQSSTQALVDFDYIPFGNAYFSTSFCGGAPWSAASRACFYQECSPLVTGQAPRAECLTGETVYQHRPPSYPAPADREGRLMLAQSCARRFVLYNHTKHDVAGSFVDLNLVACMESQLQDQYTTGPDGGVVALLDACAAREEQEPETVRRLVERVKGPECLGAGEGLKTLWRQHEVNNFLVTPAHDSVPWVVVEGEVLEDPDDLIHEVCKRLTREQASKVDACGQSASEMRVAAAASEVLESAARSATENIAIGTAWLCGAASLVFAAGAWALRRRALRATAQPAGYQVLVD